MRINGGVLDGNDLRHLRRLDRRPRPVAARPCPMTPDGAIHPNVTLFQLGREDFQAVFHGKPIYYEDRRGLWRPLSEVCAHHGNKRIVLLPAALERMSFRFFLWLCKRQRLLGSELRFGYPQGVYAGAQPRDMAFAGTLTAYPDPHPETTTVDGYVSENPAGTQSWDTAHDATAGSSAHDSQTTFLVSVNDLGGGDYAINRGFTLFDTSALTSSATISAATASLYVTSKVNSDDDGDDWINLVSSNPASNTALVTGDFDQCGDAIDNPTEFSTRLDIGSIAAGAYNDWALNASGLAAISKTGVTKLGWREGHDCIDSAPLANDRIDASSAEGAGAQRPKLVVTYTLPASAARSLGYLFG